jgi:hypothetical protein
MNDQDREAFERWAIQYMETLGYGARRDCFDPNHASAAWQAARDHYAPKLTEREAVEKAAYAIAETRYPGYGSMAKWVEVNAHRYEAEAKAALRAAGVKLKEEP